MHLFELIVKDTHRFILFFLLSIICCKVVVANDTVFMPQHPRLLVTKADIPFLKSKFSHQDFAHLKQKFTDYLNYTTTGLSDTGEPNEKIRQKIECMAYLYLLDTVANDSLGKQAVQLINIYLPSINNTKGYHNNAYAYQAVFTAALVYDWCYHLMNNEVKQQLIENMKRVACLAEYCIFKNTPKQYLTGHYGEYAPTAYLAMGIAIYNEDTSVFNFCYQEQVKNFAPSRNFWYPSGTHHQGSQYIHVRYLHELLQAFMLSKINKNPYTQNITQVAYRALYANIPQKIDMDGMPEGDCHNNINMGNNYLEFIPIAAKLSNDAYLTAYAKANINKLEKIPTRAFLFYEPISSNVTLTDLPLTRFFPSPSGLMIARTGWDLDKHDFNANTMVVLMNMREYSAKNHVHLDVGHFGIYYKGHLALDAGIYQGKDPDNGWGKTNYVNYYARTVAHNSLLILDPNEPTPYEGSNIKAIARDGGQFSFKNRAWDSTQEMLLQGKMAQIMASEISDGKEPDYSYLMGDMTRCYNVPTNVAIYPPKVDTVRRSFVFLNLKSKHVPGALIVLDKVVATNAGFQKKWLLHSQQEPVIGIGKISFTTTANGRNGKLINDILLPELNNQTIEVIGGDGKEFWVDGKNWGTVTQEDAGKYRVELSPKTNALSNNFLNVIQVTDADKNEQEFSVTKSFATNGNYVVVSISNRIVAQHLAFNKTDDLVSFRVGKKYKSYKVLVTDLKPGKWKVQFNNAYVKTVEVKDLAGTAYFDCKGNGLVTLSFIQ